MINIKICDANPLSACSYYRSIGPLSKLKKINPNIQIQYMSQITWYDIADADILFLARPQESNYLEAIKMAKDFNIPVWIDYDDCLHVLPEYNPAHTYFKRDDIRDCVEKSLELADVVTATTQKIKDYYSVHNKNIQIVENAFNDYNYKLEKYEKDTTKSISWRGSPTHRQDLLSVGGSIINISKTYSDWPWVFVGNNIEFLTDFISRKVHMGEQDVISYNKFIMNLHSAIHICPLIDNEFNHSKSNISWLEGTAAGSCVIAPGALPEFNKPGIINYKNDEGEDDFYNPDNIYKVNESFQYNLEKAIKSKDFRYRNYLKSFEHVRDNYLLSNINKKRIQIIEELIS